MWSDKCWPWDGGCLCDLANYSWVFIVWHTAIHWFPKATLVVAVQLLSWVQLFAIPWTVACQASKFLHYLPEFTPTHVHWVSDAIQPSHPPSFPSSPAFNLSQHQGLYNKSVLRISWPKYWSFSFSISPSNEHPGLIFFRMDWLDLLAV